MKYFSYTAFMSCSRLDQLDEAKISRVGQTHGKVFHVGQEDDAFDHPLDARSGLRQHRLKILDALRGLVADGALNEVSRGIERDLA